MDAELIFRSGDSLLHVAVHHGHLHVLEWLHEIHGFDLEQVNMEGKRALHEAAQAGQLSCLQYLLQKHVTIDALKRADW